ncbi:MAG: fibro-slime domain-containing protein [bacterium]|nr:fibro-slime domain-containing protein [bacterium]
MKRPSFIDGRGYCVLALAGITSMLLPRALTPPTAMAAAAPPEIHVIGVVRDFKSAHVDFNVTPSAGYGHYASNIALSLAADQRPTFVGVGRKVITQWLESNGYPIAPHLYLEAVGGGGGGSGTVPLVNGPSIIDGAEVDTYDCSGPYDPGTAGPEPTYETGVPMPAVTVPGGLTNVGTYEKTSGVHTISSDFRCDEMIVKDGAIVQISGNRRIVVDDKFALSNYGKIRLLAGATLEIYAKKDFKVENHGLLNANTAKPSLVTLYCVASGIEFYIQDDSEVYANIIAPNTEMRVQNGAHVYGSFTGKDLHLQNDAQLHICSGGGGGVPAQVCGVDANDTLGATGVSSSGGVDSASSFDEWYHDVPGTNIALAHTFTLVRNDTGVYEYLTDAFHPIDDRLWGNEGAAHNYLFTFTFKATFVYNACSDQFFEFEGADDAWFFVNNELAMDLGGVIPGTPQYVPIDRLTLIDGETYEAVFFYAQRQDHTSVFRLRTNIELTTVTPVPTTAAYD